MAPDIHENFSAVVLGGRVNAGMPSFHEQLKADDVQAIHDFLIMQATMRKAKEAGVLSRRRRRSGDDYGACRQGGCYRACC